MADKKHYLFTSLTLGLIAAGSALLIGATNIITKDRISNNEKNKINQGIAGIFGDSATVKDESEIDDENYKYVNYVYEVKQEEKDIGYAFVTTGSNAYGKISLLVGFNLENEFLSLQVVTDEQTYASALEENYIDPLNEGSRDLDDVSCGATYGAKLVRDMVKEANNASKEKVWKK